jgi:hypothetical protein
MPLEPSCFPYVYRWRSRLGLPSLAGRFEEPCRVVVRGPMNSAWIEFRDGFSACVSRNSLRRARVEK